MLLELELRYFKCFEELHLPLAPLTLLSGPNASGKSSVLQSLVLLHQTMRHHEWSTRLMLNGASVRLGTVTDLVDSANGTREVVVALEDAAARVRWTFEGERDEMSMAVQEVALAEGTHRDPVKLRHLLPPEPSEAEDALVQSLAGLTYITAERVGPREVYEIEDREATGLVGSAGEHAVSVLHWGRDERVLDDLLLPDVNPTRLRQIEARMHALFPGYEHEVIKVPHANAVTLGLRTSRATDYLRPVHVGFGLTQALPIVIAALSAAKGSVLLIENPEVHLHPAGQAMMGQFLGDVAHAGVQVLVETHSDHVLNGIRRAVKAGRLPAEEVAIHFFQSRAFGGEQVTSPAIDTSGNIDHWPDGFFDQYDRDASYFAGWGE